MPRVKLVLSHFVCLLILVLFIQCNNINNENNTAPQVNNLTKNKVTAKDIAQLKYTEYVLSDMSEAIIKDWSKFQELKTHIENLKNGNVSFFKDDKTIMQSFIADLGNETPEPINASSISVRLSVLETIMYKLEESLSLKTASKLAVINNISALLIAHNNLILQINKTVEKESRIIEKPQ